MRRAWIVVALAGLFTLSGPRAADAWVWDWVDKLSGPGPFTGWAGEWRVVCFSAKDETLPEPVPAVEHPIVDVIRALGPCLFKPVPLKKERRGSINLRVARLTTDRNRLVYPDPTPARDVRFLDLRTSAWWRPHSTVEIGIGAGLYRFSGPAFEPFWRPFLQPIIVDVKPLALLAGTVGHRHWYDEFVVFRAGHIVIPDGFDGTDFAAVPGTFRTSTEYLPTFGVHLDFEPLLRHLKGGR
jgi:hypothetical protein